MTICVCDIGAENDVMEETWLRCSSIQLQTSVYDFEHLRKERAAGSPAGTVEY